MMAISINTENSEMKVGKVGGERVSARGLYQLACHRTKLLWQVDEGNPISVSHRLQHNCVLIIPTGLHQLQVPSPLQASH